MVAFDVIGVCEFAWRDPDSALIRDRITIAILPKDFDAALSIIGGQQVVQVRGWPWGVHVKPGVTGEDGRWTIAAGVVPQTEAVVALESPGAPPLRLSIRLPHRAFIADWSGRRQSMRAPLALADLHRLVARSSQPCVLRAHLRDKEKRRVAEADLYFPFEGELALSSIRDELASLLRPFGELDATVQLAFSDADEVAASVYEFGITLGREASALRLTHGLGQSAMVVGRATHQPMEEVILGGVAASDGASLIEVAQTPGTWLVYLKQHERIVSRPIIVFGPPLSVMPTCPLGQTMAVADWSARQSAMDRLCAAAESPGPDGLIILRALLALIVRLNGLPPHTFDVLQAVARRPLLAARLAYEAGDPDLEAVMALSSGLPFAWTTIGEHWWKAAAELRFESLFTSLPETLGERRRLEIGADAIRFRGKRIGEIDAATGAVVLASKPEVSVDEAAQGFLREVHDEPGALVRSPFRPWLAPWLRDWRFDEIYWRGLDAPLAAALACNGYAKLDDLQLRCVKDVARRHPRYFHQAFVAFLKESRNA